MPPPTPTLIHVPIIGTLTATDAISCFAFFVALLSLLLSIMSACGNWLVTRSQVWTGLHKRFDDIMARREELHAKEHLTDAEKASLSTRFWDMHYEQYRLWRYERLLDTDVYRDWLRFIHAKQACDFLPAVSYQKSWQIAKEEREFGRNFKDFIDCVIRTGVDKTLRLWKYKRLPWSPLLELFK